MVMGEPCICHVYSRYSLFIKKTKKGSFSFHLDASATKQDSIERLTLFVSEHLNTHLTSIDT